MSTHLLSPYLRSQSVSHQGDILRLLGPSSAPQQLSRDLSEDAENITSLVQELFQNLESLNLDATQLQNAVNYWNTLKDVASKPGNWPVFVIAILAGVGTLVLNWDDLKKGERVKSIAVLTVMAVVLVAAVFHLVLSWSISQLEKKREAAAQNVEQNAEDKQKTFHAYLTARAVQKFQLSNDQDELSKDIKTLKAVGSKSTNQETLKTLADLKTVRQQIKQSHANHVQSIHQCVKEKLVPHLQAIQMRHGSNASLPPNSTSPSVVIPMTGFPMSSFAPSLPVDPANSTSRTNSSNDSTLDSPTSTNSPTYADTSTSTDTEIPVVVELNDGQNEEKREDQDD